MTRQEKNLAFWRSLVGLGSSFPSLPELAEADLPTMVVFDPDRLDEIRASLGSHQLTQILIEPGWGCTTLFRFLLKDARDRAMERLVLPIRIDLANTFGKDGISSEALEEEIKRQIIGLLIDNPWEQSLNRDYYYDCINFTYATDIFTYKAQARGSLFGDRPPPFRKIQAQFPWLKKPLDKLLNELLTHFRIQTGLYFHFPTDTASQTIRDLVRSIKTRSESGQVEFAALREVYVCSPEQKNEIGRDFQRPFNEIRYPKYSPAQVYAMLVKRFTPNVPGFQGRNQVSLGTVFAEAFVSESCPQATSLHDLMERVRQSLLRRLDCDPSEVPFTLEPLPGGAPPEDEPPPAPVRKKFERKRQG